ncbi:phage portal protein [Listeria booriae]|uniref:phage portal protein n=1 Tax=Listeria booriae TaxID=1552123 RepID=UPI0016297906|nr:phage portal protein [Listeria booriae]MBC1913092.1 phage portal protein [Listeria booriae]
MFSKIIAGVKGVMRRMGLLRTLKDIEHHKKVTANDKDYANIDLWKKEYMNVPDRLSLYYRHNGKDLSRRMKTMRLGKVSARYMSKLIFNEKAKFVINNDAADEFIQNTLADNGFYKNFKRYLEYAMAMGGMAMKVYHDQKRVKISYAAADSFYPLSNDSEHIDECVIPNSFQKNGKYYTLLEWHEWEDEKYVISNELFESDSADELGTKVPLKLLYDDLEARVPLEDISRPFFVYVKPNIANNYNLTSPLGISIYANAMDTMETLDMMFDAFYQEFKLGKRRVLVPSSFAKTVTDEHGNTFQYFDTRDEAFFVYQDSMDEKEGIKDVSVEIRSSDFISAINATLRIFAMQLGLSAGTFTFDENGLKTATEVISEKSETFQTKNEHSMLIEEALKDLFCTILEVGKIIGAYNGELVDKADMEINFDDSIADDDDTRINRWTNAKNQGMAPRVIAVQRAHKITKEEAEKWVQMINEEERAVRTVTDAEANKLFGGDEE